MLARAVLVISILVLAGAAIVWYRSAPDYRPGPVAEARRPDRIAMNPIMPGGAGPAPSGQTNYDVSGYDISEGQRLFRAFNCNGCHANGGGGIGPALMDDRWIYGSEPRNIYATIIEGRPNGMPAFRNKIGDQQVWQLVAYVRSLSGLVPSAVRPARSDHMQATPPSDLQPEEKPRPGGNVPPSAEATE
ncbi:MAG TPA: c-type cytochrome [Acetobacteraceae bacterium]|nr:c-type cytochrome [Acetobacteraceae bacterium]